MSDLRVGIGLRFARGLVTAAVAAGIGALCHVGAGGLLPSAPWLIAVFAGVAAVTIVSLGIPAGLLRLMALVGGGQFVTHAMLTALAGHRGDHQPHHSSADVVIRPIQVADAPGAGRQGSLHDLSMPQATSAPAPAPPHWLSHIVEDFTGPHLAMAAGHLVAALVVAWWLAQGEKALWRFILLVAAIAIGSLSALIARSSLPPIETRFPSAPAAPRRQPRLRLAPLTGGLARRGPPLVVI
ncbi:hypothetical protein AB0F44_15285 [Nocardioides sp. NPDC023903]|uniref:hypothetical protein n=1 Tax=Nocardioides sp. NPDC023903 TaxID=3157195 RepID=UPI0033FBBD7D